MTPSGPARRVVIATDKFKGSCSAAEVGASLASGIRRADPSVSVDVCPVADGGDGTVDAAAASGFELVPVVASGPTGAPVTTHYARHGEEAVIELADVCGLVRLPNADAAPMTASSRGAGEVIGAAVDAGCTRIVLGIGGSASTDGGAGMVQALGAVLVDGAGAAIGPGGGPLGDATRIDLEPVHRRLAGVDVVIASDVDNPLTGPHGAAAVYGPQKGASPSQVRALDEALDRFADVVAGATGRDERATPGSGAAGGVGFAAIALLGAHLRTGIDVVLEMVGFDGRVAGASLVVTGEGSLDEQTLRGKAPAGVAAAAARAGVPVVAVCGRNLLDTESLTAANITRVHPLSDLEPDPARSVADAPKLLERLGEQLVAEL